MSLIGWAGSLILGLSSLPQMFKVIREGHARGLSPMFLLAWGIGEVLCLLYVMPQANLPLIANYSVNLVILLVIGYYKIWRSTPEVNTSGAGNEGRGLTPKERRSIVRQLTKEIGQ